MNTPHLQLVNQKGEPMFVLTPEGRAKMRGYGLRELPLLNQVFIVPDGKKQKSGIHKVRFELKLSYLAISKDNPLPRQLGISTTQTTWYIGDRDNNPSGGGQGLDDLIPKLYKLGAMKRSDAEWWREVIQFHLFDFNSGKMHYLANSLYWFERGYEQGFVDPYKRDYDRWTVEDAQQYCKNNLMYGWVNGDDNFDLTTCNVYELSLWAKRRFAPMLWQVAHQFDLLLNKKQLSLMDYVVPNREVHNGIVEQGRVYPPIDRNYPFNVMDRPS